MYKHFLATLLLLAATITVFGQSPASVTVSGQQVLDSNGKPLTGQLAFIVTDTTDTPITYTPQGGSPTTATQTVPVKNGAVQYYQGFPSTIWNPDTISPANTRYRMIVQATGGSPTYYTFPLVQIVGQTNFTYDGYAVPQGVTATGHGDPHMPCGSAGQYTNIDAVGVPYPWVCSKLSTDGTIVWTQNPSQSPLCAQGNNQAVASPTNWNNPQYCVPATNAYVTPGYVYAGPTPNNVTAGQVGLVPISLLCAGGACGSGGDVNPGTLDYLSAYVGLANPSTSLGPTAGVAVDHSTRKNLFGPGAAIFNSGNYNGSAAANGAIAQPYANNSFYNVSTNSQGVPAYNQAISGVSSVLSWSGDTNGALVAGSGFNNAGANNRRLITRVNGQTNAVDDNFANYAGNDLVAYVLNAVGTGVLRGDNEGAWEYLRQFLWINQIQWGGTTTALGNDALGNPIFRITTASGYDNSHAASSRFVIDLSTPWGTSNIALIGTAAGFGQPYLGQFTGDGSSGITAHFGISSKISITGGADTLKYGTDNQSCTATGGQWDERDPYAGTDAQGGGTLTAHKCISVDSTAGLSVGTLLAIGSTDSNFEYETVQQIVDATHIRLNLKFQHYATEPVTFGGGVGYGACMNADMLPPRSLNYNIQQQPNVLHVCYPIVATYAGDAVVVFTNSTATFGNAEIHTTAMGRNTPVTPATLTLTNTGNTITGVTTNSNSYPGLAPPQITYSGFSVNPVITWTPDPTASKYNPVLVSGGTCTSSTCAGATATPQTVYPNPITFYPMGLTRIINDPSAGCPPESPADRDCPTNGYMGLFPTVAGFGATGHTVETVPNWNPYVSSQVRMNGNLLSVLSGKTGPYFQRSISGLAAAVIDADINEQDPAVYNGHAINNWMLPDPSLSPCPSQAVNRLPASPCYSSTDGLYGPIAWHGYYGAYGTGAYYSTPPSGGIRGPQPSLDDPVGSLFAVGCDDNFAGIALPARCNFGLYDAWNLVVVNEGSGALSIVAKPARNQWFLKAAGGVTTDTSFSGPTFKGDVFTSTTGYFWTGETGVSITTTAAGFGNYNYFFNNGANGASSYNFGPLVQFDQFGNINILPNVAFQQLKFGNGAVLGAKSAHEMYVAATPSSGVMTFTIGDPNGVVPAPILVWDSVNPILTISNVDVDARAFALIHGSTQMKMQFGGATSFTRSMLATLPGSTACLTIDNTGAEGTTACGGGGGITLTTTGTSGPATLIGTTLNIPVYTAGGGGVSDFLFTNANGFTGSVVTSTTTPTLTLNVDGSHYLPTTSDQANWNAKAPIANPTFTGSVLGPYFQASSALPANQTSASIFDFYAAGHSGAGDLRFFSFGPAGVRGGVQILGLQGGGGGTAIYMDIDPVTTVATFTGIAGPGSGITGLNASNLSSGVAPAAVLPVFGSAVAGIVPLSGGGTINFLRADGAWAAPPGGSGITGLTTGYIPQATSPTAIGNSFIDYGVTNAGAYTSTKEFYMPAIHTNDGTSIGGGYDWTQGASPTGVASHDLIYAYTTANRLWMNNNNTGGVQIVGAGVDINTSDQVTATHLSSPLPLAQGGNATATPALTAGTNITLSGSWPNYTINATATGSGTVSSATANQIARYGASGTTVSGDTTLNSNGAGVLTFSTAVTAAQSTITEGNTANTNGHVHTINCNTSQSGNPLGVNNQFGTAFYVGCDGRLNLGSLIAFNGISTFADSQIPIITAGSSHAAAAVTNGTTNVTLIASAIAGSYEVCGTLTVAAVGTAGTIALSMTYNNGASQTITGTPATVLTTTAGNSVTIPCQVIRLAATTALTYTVTGAALTGSPTIFRDVHVKVLSQP